MVSERKIRIFRLALCLCAAAVLLLSAVLLYDKLSVHNDEIVCNFSTGDGAATQDGYYMMDFIDGIVCRYDYKTQQSEIMCKRPNCRHNNLGCAAYSWDDFRKSNFIVAGRTIYYFYHRGNGVTIISAADIDTGERTVIARENLNYVYDVMLVGNKIYYYGEQRMNGINAFEELDEIYVMRCLDLEDNTITTVLNEAEDPMNWILFKGGGSESIFFIEMHPTEFPFDYAKISNYCLKGAIYSAYSACNAKLKKFSLDTQEITTVADMQNIVFDYYDTHAFYFLVKDSEVRYTLCRLDYKSGEVSELFSTGSEINYIVADENKIMYALEDQNPGEFNTRNCVVFDMKTKTEREVHFTDEGYLYFSAAAEYGDYFIGDLVYESRRFRIQLRKEDLFSGKNAKISDFDKKDERYIEEFTDEADGSDGVKFNGRHDVEAKINEG